MEKEIDVFRVSLSYEFDIPITPKVDDLDPNDVSHFLDHHVEREIKRQIERLLGDEESVKALGFS